MEPALTVTTERERGALHRRNARDQPFLLIKETILYGGRLTLVSDYEPNTGRHHIEYLDGDGYETYQVNLYDTDTEWSELPFAVGDDVEALWPADGKYYLARVTGIRYNDTIEISLYYYDDGNTRSNARMNELRKIVSGSDDEEDEDFEDDEELPVSQVEKYRKAEQRWGGADAHVPKDDRIPLKKRKSSGEKIKKARKRVRFGLKVKDHDNDEDRAEQSLLNKLANEAKFAADLTIWGHGEDKLGSRMGRAEKYAKRVADPKDPYTYRDARHAMRPRKGRKFADKRRGMIYEAGKAPVPIAKNKKSA